MLAPPLDLGKLKHKLKDIQYDPQYPRLREELASKRWCAGLYAGKNFGIHDHHKRKTQYCTLSNKRCPSEHSVRMNYQALPRSHSFKLLGVSITESMIAAAGKKARISIQSQEVLLTIQPSHAIQSPHKT
nr:unnamed protein product [Callosobruchus chinensis]